MSRRREAADLARALELSTQQAATLSVLSPHWLSSSNDTSGAMQDSKEMELRPYVNSVGEAEDGGDPGVGVGVERNAMEGSGGGRSMGSGEIMPPPMTVTDPGMGDSLDVSSGSSGVGHGCQSEIHSFTPSNPNPIPNLSAHILVQASNSNSNPQITPSTTHSSSKSVFPPSSFPLSHRPSDPAYSSPMPLPPAAQPSPQYPPETRVNSSGSHSHPSHVSNTEMSSNRPLFSPTQVSSAPRSDALVSPILPTPRVVGAAAGGEEPAPAGKKVKMYGKANRTAISLVDLPVPTGSANASVRAGTERQSSPRTETSTASRQAAVKPKPKSKAVISSDEEDEPVNRGSAAVPAALAAASAPPLAAAAANTTPPAAPRPSNSIEVIPRPRASRSPIKRPAETAASATASGVCGERGRHSPDPLDSLDVDGAETPMKRPRGSISSRAGGEKVDAGVKVRAAGPPAAAGDTQQSDVSLSVPTPSSASRRVSSRVADARVKEEQEKEERRRKRREEKERDRAGAAAKGAGEVEEGAKGKRKEKREEKSKKVSELPRQTKRASVPVSRVEAEVKQDKLMEVDPPAAVALPPASAFATSVPPPATSNSNAADPNAPALKSRKRKSSIFDPHAPVPPLGDDSADEDFLPGESANSKRTAKGKGKGKVAREKAVKEKVVREKKRPSKKGRKSGVEVVVPLSVDGLNESGTRSAPASVPEAASAATDATVVEAEPLAVTSLEKVPEEEEEEEEEDKPIRRESFNPTPPTPAPAAKTTSPPATTPALGRERQPLGRTPSNLTLSTPAGGPSGLHRGSPVLAAGKEGTPSGGVRWKTPRNDLSSVLAKFGGTKRSGMSRNLKIVPLHAKIGPPAKALPPVPKKAEKRKKGEESDDEDEEGEGEEESDGEGGVRRKKKGKGMEWFMVED